MDVPRVPGWPGVGQSTKTNVCLAQSHGHAKTAFALFAQSQSGHLREVYTLRQNAVIYAGSSLYIREWLLESLGRLLCMRAISAKRVAKVTANNPDTALQRMDPTNRWQVLVDGVPEKWQQQTPDQVSLTSKGYHQYEVTFPPVSWPYMRRSCKHRQEQKHFSQVIFNTVMQNFSSNTAAALDRACSRINEVCAEHGLFAAGIGGSAGKDHAASDSSIELDVLRGKLRSLGLTHFATATFQFVLLPRREELSWHRAS